MTRAPLAISLAAVFLATLALPTAPARAREDGAPAASLGMADAVTSSAVGTAGLYYNPAGMGLAHQYQFEAGYTFEEDRAGHTFGAGAVDSRTNPALAMGIGYAFINSELNGADRGGHRIRGGLATGHSWQNVGFQIGLGGHYLSLDRGDAVGDARFFTLDAGMILTFAQVFRIGVAAQNLIDTKAADEAPRRVNVGASVVIQQFEIAFDTELDLQTCEELDTCDGVTPSYRVGGQALLGESVVTRLGFQADGVTDGRSVTAGLGYVSKVLAADVSIAKRVDHPDGWLASVALRYFLP